MKTICNIWKEKGIVQNPVENVEKSKPADVLVSTLSPVKGKAEILIVERVKTPVSQMVNCTGLFAG